MIAERLNELRPFDIDLSRVQTNIVVAEVNERFTTEQILNDLRNIGVWAVPFGPTRVRFVTHLDVSTDDCTQAMNFIDK